MEKKVLKIATRKSILALWQTNYVASLLKKVNPNLKIELIELSTRGDLILDKSLSKIGGKSLFMKELEVAILNKKADIAVHSLKDIPYKLPKNFILGAFCKRHNPFDAFISNKFKNIQDLPKNAIIGTSSLRRKSQILSIREDLIIKDLRGNIHTRLKKLDDGLYDGIILAKAGLERLNLNFRIKEELKENNFIPSVGQGVIAVELLENSPFKNIVSKINNIESQICINAERSFNKYLNGSCQTPIGAYSTLKNNILNLKTFVSNIDGTNILKYSLDKNIKNLSDEKILLESSNLGIEVAKKMISLGVKKYF